MLIQTKNNKQVELRKLCKSDLEDLFIYLQNLSEETRKRFGPHKFDIASIREFYDDETIAGFIAIDPGTQEIVAYAIIKTGFLEPDSARLQSYGLRLDKQSDCTFAPSVADQWQSCGIGSLMFGYICSNWHQGGITRIILWGGVQSDNEKALKYYLNHGFRTLGQFEHNGNNYDMILDKFQIESA